MMTVYFFFYQETEISLSKSIIDNIVLKTLNNTISKL